MSDSSSVDLLHDVHGLEVCGIREEADVRTIRDLLRRLFPDWRFTHHYYKDGATREPGWKVVISRDPENSGDRWQTAD